jgi:hypothetical protein
MDELERMIHCSYLLLVSVLVIWNLNWTQVQDVEHSEKELESGLGEVRGTKWEVRPLHENKPDPEPNPNFMKKKYLN